MSAPVGPRDLPIATRAHRRKEPVSDRPQISIRPASLPPTSRPMPSVQVVRQDVRDRESCPWTEEDNALLLHLSDVEDKSIEEIACIMRRSDKSCSKQLWKLIGDRPEGSFLGNEPIEDISLRRQPARMRGRENVVVRTIAAAAPALAPERNLDEAPWEQKDIEDLIACVKLEIENKRGEGAVARQVSPAIWEAASKVMGCSAAKCQEVAKALNLDFTRRWTEVERRLAQNMREQGSNNWESQAALKLLETRTRNGIREKLKTLT